MTDTGGTRKKAKNEFEKVTTILDAIREERWTLGDFLYHLFHVPKDADGKKAGRSQRHIQMVTSLLNGSTEHTFVEILNRAYALATKINVRTGDATHPTNGLFSRTRNAQEILHAQTALNTWAIQTTLQFVQTEAALLVEYDSGLHLRAGSTRKSGSAAEAASSLTRGSVAGDAAVAVASASHKEQTRNTYCVTPSASVEVTVTGLGACQKSSPTSAELADDTNIAIDEGESGEPPLGDADSDSLEVEQGPESLAQTGAGAEAGGEKVTGTETVAQGQSSAKKKRKPAKARPEALVTWERLNLFSFAHLQDVLEAKAPVFWHIVNGYANPTHGKEGKVTVVRKRRPQTLACAAQIASLTFTLSNRANLFALARGVWLFATKAHRTIFRVDSRLGYSVAYDSVYRALHTMADALQDMIKDIISGTSGRWFDLVGDNIQTYAKQRDPRIGRLNKMIKGFAGTLIELVDVHPSALDLHAFIENRQRLRRQELTVHTIFEDIDFEHLLNVAIGQFLQTLLSFAPALDEAYRKDLDKFYQEKIRKFQIEPTRKSNVIPLATNSADEMTLQGMNTAVQDFLSQMGITDETLRDRLLVFSGDGKTFDQLLKLKRVMTPHETNVESLRFVVPMLELWHTKWTDLCRTLRASWGKGHANDPSTLGRLAAAIEMPAPSDLQKIPFYDGAHLLDVALDAHLLNCWEISYHSTDLAGYFKHLADMQKLPTFDELLCTARRLAERHATTRAFSQARSPVASARTADSVPYGSPWDGTRNGGITEPPVLVPGPSSRKNKPEEEKLSDLTEEEKRGEEDLKPDATLANTTLFIRNGIWWREESQAAALGDTGRIWEILKVWLFTFAGSGNPNYCQYLLELYCMFKWELPEPTRKLILNNWLVNLHGRPGHFIEKDLMQEHFNFWLEDLAQHKGAEFDSKFYRDVISMNVHHFLRLKEEMEESVSLKAKSKKHGSTHPDNELRAILEILRKEEVNYFRPGRSYGFDAEDDFSKGFRKLEEKTVDEFIKRTVANMDILGTEQLPTGEEENDGNDGNDGELPEGLLLQPPPPPLRMIHGELHVPIAEESQPTSL